MNFAQTEVGLVRFFGALKGIARPKQVFNSSLLNMSLAFISLEINLRLAKLNLLKFY
jgi:hypothetical protein